MDDAMITLLIAGLLIGGPALWGITDSVLSHRRKMAEIKYGRSEREEQLSVENTELTETVAHMQDRLAVLETIATDPARRIANEIEELR